MKPHRIAPAALLALGACKAPDVPRSPAPWITLGASDHVVTSLDTSRIVAERGTRVVWVRQTTAIRPAPDSAATSTREAESRHRVNCGTRTVADLEPAGATRPFDQHPYGKRVFATVCNALGILPARPSNG
jgi:hypothetical protein